MGRESDADTGQDSNGDVGQDNGGDENRALMGTQDQAPGGHRGQLSPEGDLCRVGWCHNCSEGRQQLLRLFWHELGPQQILGDIASAGDAPWGGEGQALPWAGSSRVGGAGEDPGFASQALRETKTKVKAPVNPDFNLL